MEKTGQTFDMNAETFTLQNIFAMELHRFQDKIAEIVNCAIKELAIEKVSSLLFFSLLFSSGQTAIKLSGAEAADLAQCAASDKPIGI